MYNNNCKTIQLQLTLKSADKCAAVFELLAQLTTHPSLPDGKPTAAEIRQLIQLFQAACEEHQAISTWTRTATSITRGYDDEKVRDDFKRVFESTDSEQIAQLAQEAATNARRAVSRRSDQATLANINRGPHEALATLTGARRTRRVRRRITLTTGSGANATAVAQPVSPPTDPRLGTLAAAAAHVDPDTFDLTDEDAASLPIGEIDTSGDLTNVDGADAYERFLAIEAQNAPAGGLTIADSPSALQRPLVSSSSSEGEI